MAGATDASLVLAVARYQDRALAEIYRRHGGGVHALAARILGAGGRAEDVTQDVFVTLWDAPERFDPERGSLRTYLLTIAHRRSVDRLRADRARSDREVREALARRDVGYDLEREVGDLIVADRVRGAVSSLPERERQAIEMSYFGGHTYREVAALLGVAEGTVKSRIRSGLVRMRGLLAQSGLETMEVSR
jgi:RNA polymerase sigma-70 factor (ECF subfamily)